LGEEGRKKLFVVGCPRSGTTWVQLLLSQHPAVVTAPETQIFAYYLVHFQRQWRLEHEGPGSTLQGRAGLSRLLSETDFEELCRLTAQAVLDRIAARNPDASVIVEKSPKHALMADFIHRIFPDAYFLNVIRDPRDASASLMAAGRSWGAGWAPKSAIPAARMWRDHVESARRVRPKTERYREVFYERLQEDPAEGLRGILEWLGIARTPEECEQMVRACEFEKLQKTAPGKEMPLPGGKSPKGFFRKGKVGGWRDELPAGDVRVIEHICADLMAECGYEPANPPPARAPLRVPVHDAIQRVRESIDWQLEKLLYRV
jgi:hypothetical protein